MKTFGNQEVLNMVRYLRGQDNTEEGKSKSKLRVITVKVSIDPTKLIKDVIGMDIICTSSKWWYQTFT
ncbi:MAG: hypothetical protein CM15mV23_1230 [Eurybiavirus sp.]|nr:MAG: hypothetical protein CM15mV23_1230 [Eurybiavirus sp.]